MSWMCTHLKFNCVSIARSSLSTRIVLHDTVSSKLDGEEDRMV